MVSHKRSDLSSISFSYKFSNGWLGKDGGKREVQITEYLEKEKELSLLKEKAFFIVKCFLLVKYTKMENTSLKVKQIAKNLYHISSTKRPWHLLNFETVRCSAY